MSVVLSWYNDDDDDVGDDDGHDGDADHTGRW